jgi:hypothetical protein
MCTGLVWHWRVTSGDFVQWKLGSIKEEEILNHLSYSVPWSYVKRYEYLTRFEDGISLLHIRCRRIWYLQSYTKLYQSHTHLSCFLLPIHNSIAHHAVLLVTNITCIREVSGLNLCWNTSYSVSDFSVLSVIEAIFGAVPIIATIAPSLSFQI